MDDDLLTRVTVGKRPTTASPTALLRRKRDEIMERLDRAENEQRIAERNPNWQTSPGRIQAKERVIDSLYQELRSVSEQLGDMEDNLLAVLVDCTRCRTPYAREEGAYNFAGRCPACRQ